MNPQRCMARSATSRGVLVARASRRLRSTQRPYLTAAQSSTRPCQCDVTVVLRPRERHECSHGGDRWLGAHATFSSTGCVNAFVKLHVSYVVTVLRTLMCGDRKFSSHDWVNPTWSGTTSRMWRSSLTPQARSHGAACGWRCWLTRRTTSKRSCQGSPRIRILAVTTSRLRTTRLPSTSRTTRVWKRCGAKGRQRRVVFIPPTILPALVSKPFLM